jgi:hypothetical protein
MATARFEQDFITVFKNEGRKNYCYYFTDLSNNKNCMFTYCFATDIDVGVSLGGMHTEYIVVKDNCMDQQRAGGTFKDTIGFFSVTNDPKYPYPPGLTGRDVDEGFNASAKDDTPFKVTSATLEEWEALWPAPKKRHQQIKDKRQQSGVSYYI